MIPFYIFYSMFGFQRIGDLAWAAGDMQARGFLIGATYGRTTLNGEGLQHQDGHSHLVASTIPNCVSYDPTFSYEVAVIVREGMRRMYQEQENVFYYVTTLNENYAHPEMPKNCEEGIISGMYLFQPAKASKSKKKPVSVQLLGCGSILNEVIAAAELLEKDFKVVSDIWSVTSFNELARDGQNADRANMLNPEAKVKQSYVASCLTGHEGPVIASTDSVKAYAEQIRGYVPGSYTVLGTDGFGRSDSRENLRRFFEIDRYFVALAALKALADEGKITAKQVSKAIKLYNIDINKPNPLFS